MASLSDLVLECNKPLDIKLFTNVNFLSHFISFNQATKDKMLDKRHCAINSWN